MYQARAKQGVREQSPERALKLPHLPPRATLPSHPPPSPCCVARLLILAAAWRPRRTAGRTGRRRSPLHDGALRTQSRRAAAAAAPTPAPLTHPPRATHPPCGDCCHRVATGAAGGGQAAAGGHGGAPALWPRGIDWPAITSTMSRMPLRKRLPARLRSLRPWGPSWGTVHA